MVHVPLMFLPEWREFPSAPCLAGKKNLMTAGVSMLLKSRASPDMLPFSLCNKKRLAIRHMNRPPFSNDTTDSVLRRRDVGRPKDLSEPPRTCCGRLFENQSQGGTNASIYAGMLELLLECNVAAV